MSAPGSEVCVQVHFTARYDLIKWIFVTATQVSFLNFTVIETGEARLSDNYDLNFNFHRQLPALEMQLLLPFLTNFRACYHHKHGRDATTYIY